MSAFQSSTFSGVVGSQQLPVHFVVIRMTKSFFIWIGDDSKMLSSLSVAMPPFRGSPEALSSSLIGGQTSSLGQAISCKLAKKTACQVLVSVSLNFCEQQTELELLKRILEEMSTHPEYFYETPASSHTS